MFTAALFMKTKRGKHTMSIQDEQISKMLYAHTLKCYTTIKKNSNIGYNMDEP
jgi:hypothetical protein